MDNTTATNGLRPIAVTLSDFKGQTTRIDLRAAATLLCGMNGKGKTSVLEALHLAFAGTLPGYRVSQMDVATLQSLAGPSGRWTIEVEMSDGGTIRREFLGIQTRVRVSAPGIGILADRNDDHEAALAARYGDWSLTLNLADLTTMTPDALKAFVLDLCARVGGSAAWTPAQVCKALQDRVPAIGDVQPDEGVDGPVAQVDLLEEQLSGALTDCRRDIREANTRRRVEVPEVPDPGMLEDSSRQVQDGESRLADVQRRKGAADAAVAQARSARQTAQAEVDRLVVAVEAAQKTLAVANVEMPPPAPTAPTARDALAAIQQTAPAPLPEGIDAASLAGLDKQLHDLEIRAAGGAETVKAAGRRVKEIRERVARYSEGVCPECGQPAASHVQKLEDEARAAAEELRTAADAQAEATRQIAETRASRDKTFAAIEKHTRATTTYAKKVTDAEKAVADADLADERARAEADRKQAAQQAERAAAQTRFDELTAALARAREAAFDDGTFETDSTDLDQELATVTEDLRLARADLEELRRKELEAREAVAARDNAEADHARFQEWQTTVKLAIEAMQGVRREVIGAFVDPLVSRVNDFIGGYLGTFEARFAPRFVLGFRRAHGDSSSWIPLQRLSEGEFALAAIALAWALCELRQPPMRLLAMDDIEHLDDVNLPAFLGAVAANAVGASSGGFDLVMLAGRGRAAEYRPMCVDTGIAIVDLDEVRSAASDGAATAA